MKKKWKEEEEDKITNNLKILTKTQMSANI